MRIPMLGVLVCGVVAPLCGQAPAQQPPDAAEQTLRAIVTAAPQLPFEGVPLTVTSPVPGFALGMVSWVSSTRDGTTYLLQRGDCGHAQLLTVQSRHVRISRQSGVNAT